MAFGVIIIHHLAFAMVNWGTKFEMSGLKWGMGSKNLKSDITLCFDVNFCRNCFLRTKSCASGLIEWRVAYMTKAMSILIVILYRDWLEVVFPLTAITGTVSEQSVLSEQSVSAVTKTVTKLFAHLWP